MVSHRSNLQAHHSPATAPRRAAPITPLPESCFSQYLVLPVPVRMVRPVSTLDNPGTNGPALSLPTPPFKPSGNVPEREEGREGEQAWDMKGTAHV